MGQKVNPKGLRLGIIYNWSSRWFFSKKKTYRDNLILDIKIREKLMAADNQHTVIASETIARLIWALTTDDELPVIAGRSTGY